MTTAAEISISSTPDVGAIRFRGFEDASCRTASSIRSAIASRRLRDSYFPGELFADPVWDILLELTAAKLDGQRVPMSALCAAAGVPATTALRHIHDLESRKMVIRRPDPNDKRRVFVELSADSYDAMLAYLQSSEVAGNARL